MIHINETARTKVFLDDTHVKTIPNKYTDIFKEKHIINPLKKRLTREERFQLEVSLFEKQLFDDHRYAYNLIKRSSPDFVQIVTTPFSKYYELVYKNRMKVKVSADLYNLSIDKKEIKRNY
ncbi:hypothetical protein SAMN04487764_1529 [Gillisia sp. Hel1_33_143]|uniref:hypothetical protein n=1 Tax=Gillisia sp. Hel1_33_143 TaxID=1336796 RepID=UPI00087AC5A6|nr:hypothetical protein [Gillisia sp. Hel1_33_143]SDS13422.1 hypothetical protein SAMN04487764_1529 [Gillisia sp. Hel1_33_143]